jgi:hypothetical protein
MQNRDVQHRVDAKQSRGTTAAERRRIPSGKKSMGTSAAAVTQIGKKNGFGEEDAAPRSMINAPRGGAVAMTRTELDIY